MLLLERDRIESVIIFLFRLILRINGMLLAKYPVQDLLKERAGLRSWLLFGQE